MLTRVLFQRPLGIVFFIIILTLSEEVSFLVLFFVFVFLELPHWSHSSSKGTHSLTTGRARDELLICL